MTPTDNVDTKQAYDFGFNVGLRGEELENPYADVWQKVACLEGYLNGANFRINNEYVTKQGLKKMLIDLGITDLKY